MGEKKALPGTWYQPRDHPVHALFKRGASSDDFPTVGSPTWAAAYPTGTPDPSQNRPEWTAALNAAVAAGTIPDVPLSTSTGGTPVYPNGISPTSADVCSASYGCRNLEYDMWDAPDGTIGIGFDDGPLPQSTPDLEAFLAANGQKATHFMIGQNILNNPSEFSVAANTNKDDIAVHTWTHPYMTTLDNTALLGQFGWTVEIIHNSTGGLIPKYWRPPYGDVDNRVRAVAKEVFGLTTVVWNQDSGDWSIGNPGGKTAQQVNASMAEYISGPKTPGLIILEHELSDVTVKVFTDAYPVMKASGWNTISIAELQDS
ncbi:carbohydrate esterase family 4 protein [Plicaturopsis crispa FD-325 SS-3]|nr:carbohydrate esterase family 4 protein [Plicaturopsis crispa FD-325 SS-3]